MFFLLFLNIKFMYLCTVIKTQKNSTHEKIINDFSCCRFCNYGFLRS